MTRPGKRGLDSHGPLAPRDLDRPCGLDSPPVRQDLLERFFPVVRSLRQHVLFKLPAASRLRRRKIAMLGSRPDACGGSLESRLANALDTTLVCAGESQPLPESAVAEAEDLRWQQWACFSQKGDDSNITLSDGVASAIAVQSEIVDFVIWLLFSRHGSCGGRPNHLLCDGLRRGVAADDTRRTSVPGVIALHPNARLEAMKREPWPHILALLGRSGQRIMINMLMDCSVFVRVDVGLQNYYQYSGTPLHSLTMGPTPGSPSKGPSRARKPSEITLVRSRIFYAKPTLSSRGVIQSGYKHIHALNRFRYVREPEPGEEPDRDLRSQTSKSPEQRNDANTLKLLMYIFPRQFGLHNVFTSEVDVKQTSQAFQDYTLRPEEDLLKKASRTDKVESGNQSNQLPKVPRRLRGPVKDLVRRLQILHGKCSYFELLRHYCPAPIDNPPTEAKAHVGTMPSTGSRSKRKSASQLSVRSGPRCKQQHRAPNNRELRSRRFASSQAPCELKYESLVEMATPYAHVSAFCQAVLSKIIPDRFWGNGPLSHNKTVFLSRIDHFIKLRRFEAISLHEIAQDFKISDLEWLQPPNCQGPKASQTDMEKRRELFHEFLYYVFDSLLIPLIRSHFYVTETNSHRLQIFYFRHDIWRVVADSALSDLKTGMFEEIKSDEAKSILSRRRLGFGLMRLLPKGRKMRPITNLKRRSLPLARDPRMPKTLGPSVNSILQPVHAMLKHERVMNPSKLGSALFAVGDLYERIKSFKRSLPPGEHAFFFAKLDVTAAFDTIPQSAVVALMRSIPRQTTYVMTKHVEMKPGDRPLQYRHGSARGRPTRRWLTTAIEDGESSSFLDRLEGRLGKGKRNTVFIDNPVLRSEDVGTLMNLLAQHVGQNIIKIGKKYYRQRKGIPQGSVLSSFLCNYFYADLEAKYLDFLDGPDCLLMRLIDDFLLITLDRSKAVRFVQVMHQGFPDYGVEVNPSKTMVNFDMSIEDGQVRKVSQSTGFPYCGTFINCETLEISKSHERDSSVHISASLTIHYGRSPGQNFQKKILHAFGLQSHAMFFDTEHNSKATVLRSLRGAFDETAQKMWAYLRCLPAARRPNEKLISHTIFMLANVAFSILTGKSRRSKFESYACDIRKRDISLIAYSAFFDFLTGKQTRFGNVLSWLTEELARLRSVAS